MNNRQRLLKKLEELFGDEPLNPAGEELFNRFLFAYTGKGSGINGF